MNVVVRRRRQQREGSSVIVDSEFATPSLADEDEESSGYRNDTREDDSDANSGVDPDKAAIPDHVRLEGLPQKVEMPWRTQARLLVGDRWSWVDDGIVTALRSRCSVPDAVKIRVPLSRDRPTDAPLGCFISTSASSRSSGYVFPLFFSCWSMLSSAVSL